MLVLKSQTPGNIRPHVNYEYCYYYSFVYSTIQTKISNEQVRVSVYFEDETERSGSYLFTGMMYFVVYRPDLRILFISKNL